MKADIIIPAYSEDLTIVIHDGDFGVAEAEKFNEPIAQTIWAIRHEGLMI